MRNSLISYIMLAFSLMSVSVLSQADTQAESDSTLLGLPGDGLDLFAVLDLFQKSPSIEEFEKSLNLEESGVNNLDLNLDEKVDFIKVVTEQDGDDFAFVLQVDVSEDEIQDVAVILVSKDKDEKVTLQVVGDEDLYGKDYVIEPAPPAPAVTANPAYSGDDPVVSKPATTEVIVVESAPIVKYVYSPVYVPYYPPYHYAFYPPYFAAFTVVAVGIYRHNHYYPYHGYHGGYHGGYRGNTVVIHNHNTYNNYNNNRNRSNTVNHNNASGNYNKNRPSTGQQPANRPSQGGSAGARPSTGQQPANRPSTGQQPAARPSTGQQPANRPSQGGSSTARPSTGQQPAARPSTNQSRGGYSSSSPSQSNRSASPSRSMNSSPSRSASPSRGGGGGRRR